MTYTPPNPVPIVKRDVTRPATITGPARPDTLPSECEQSILAEAQVITGGDRQNDYGTPEENWGRISKIASAMCEMDLSPEVCTKVLIATKLARMITSPGKRDNYVDLAGYAHVLWQVVQK